MAQNIIHIGIDVDDQAFHGAAFIAETGEVLEFKSRPTTKGLCNQMEKMSKQWSSRQIKICYEATYTGFTLQRELSDKGFLCEVIAPSSIPRVHGNQVKTDRIDAAKLAQFYASGILTIVMQPEPEMERDRDLMRSREFILHQLSDIRSHIQSLLRRNNMHYKAETKNASHWTKHHLVTLAARSSRHNCQSKTGTPTSAGGMPPTH
jgi:transposase